MNRNFLVIGGTGMLHDFCMRLPADKLVMASRFVSHTDNVKSLPPTVEKISLDYSEPQSCDAFFAKVAMMPSLHYCILWVHSPCHDFSRKLMEHFARLQNPPKFIHVFGTTNMGNKATVMKEFASDLGVEFHSIVLGSVKTEQGNRWLTHDEISQLVWDKYQTIMS